MRILDQVKAKLHGLSVWVDAHLTAKQQVMVLSGVVVLLVGGTGAYWYNSPAQRAKRAEAAVSNLLKHKKYEAGSSNSKFNYNAAGWTPTFKDLLQYRNGSGNKVRLRSQVSIPALNIDVPVFDGVSNYTLAWGAGTARPNENLGENNYAIQGHNYLGLSYARNWFLSNLQKQIAPQGAMDLGYVRAKNGMKVYAIDQHDVYTYKIFREDIINTQVPTAANVLTSSWNKMAYATPAQKKYRGTPVLTMSTCYAQYNVAHPIQRLVVTSQLVKKTPVKQFSQLHKYFKNAKTLY